MKFVLLVCLLAFYIPKLWELRGLLQRVVEAGLLIGLGLLVLQT